MEAPARPAGQLLRVLGLAFGLATVVGGVIGAGILRQPGVVAGAVGDPVVIVSLWVAGAIMAAVNAFTVVELGASLPRAGGPYALVSRGLGPRAGALVGWADWFNGMSTLAFLAVAFAEFLQRAGLFADRPLGLIAVALVLAAFVLNWTGTRTNGFAQTLLSGAKGVALALILVGLLLAPAVPQPPPSEAPGAALGLAALALAMRAIHNSYTGYQTPIYVGEELKNPARNVARAVFGGLAVVAGLYILINIALLRVLTVEEMAASPLALAEGAVRAFGPNGGLAVAAFGALSVAASVNLRLMTHSRGAFAMARDGALPAPLARVAPGGSPRVALTVTMLGGVALAASGAYLAIVAINAPLRILIEIALILTLIRLRRTAPELPRPVRMPFYPLPALLALLANTALLVAVSWEDPRNSGLALGAVALAAAFVWWRR
ncbi:APC family permease [Thermaurantiacus tibetensis]|uniref:APC family permease n=1 Tax=Thermaurantiacus tibetensis TaxID=2759035 RepID=UPI00188F0A85|nr:APC family permease [Thermaurantiacus tibetensis]